MKRTILNRKGFTLIELLVVVLIIGILSSVALPQYTQAVEKSRASEALQTISGLKKAFNMYVLENGFPAEDIEFLGDGANGAGLLTIDFESGLDCSSAGLQGKACASKNFVYSLSCDGGHACWIYAERRKDGGYDNNQYYFVSVYMGGKWDVGNCNYRNSIPYTKNLCNSLKSFGWEPEANP